MPYSTLNFNKLPLPIVVAKDNLEHKIMFTNFTAIKRRFDLKCCNNYLFRFVAFIAHASIICSHFSQKQSANQPKKIKRECFTTKLKGTCNNSSIFEGKKFSPKKVT